jgi:hypothetical protein
MTVVAMLEWLRLLRKPPEFRQDRFTHLIMHSYATHRCDAVRASAVELRTVLHLFPPGLADLPRPLDRSVFGGFKGEY